MEKIKYAIVDKDTAMYVTNAPRELRPLLERYSDWKKLPAQTGFNCPVDTYKIREIMFQLDGACLMFDDYRLTKHYEQFLQTIGIRAELVTFKVSM